VENPYRQIKNVYWLYSIFYDGFSVLIFEYAVISIPILFLAFIFFSILLGYWESKLGLKEEEHKKLTTQNPLMMELIQDIKEIKFELSKKNN